MKRTFQTHRLAMAALFAAAVAPSHLVLAQETAPPDPLATERPVTLPPTTSPVVTTPSTTTTTTSPAEPIVPAPLPRATAAPPPATEAVQPAAPETTRRRTTTRTETRRSQPVRVESTSAPAPVAAETPPPAAEAAPAPAPTAVAAPAEAPPAAPAEPTLDRNLLGLIGAGVLALLAALVAFALLRRRRRARDEAYEEPVYEEPVAAPEPALAAAPAVEPIPASAFAPAAAIPLADWSEHVDEPVIEPARVSVAEVDAADAEAVTAGSEPAPGRPWLEFFLRPVRAGIDDEAATVEFDLIVGNTGSEPARDVRVSAFMFPAGSAGESEMERMLIERRGEAAELALDAGDAARVEGAASLPKQALAGEVLPVVVADARYRLPDGSEGRMRAAFEVGRAEGESLAPFAADRPTGLTGEVATRLHGEVERV
jgi:hypothetical protein